MPTFSSATSLYEDFANPEETVFDENAISNALHNVSVPDYGELILNSNTYTHPHRHSISFRPRLRGTNLKRTT